MSDTPRTDDTCTHDLSEQETACADGFCPICATIKLIERSRLIYEAKDKIVQLECELDEARNQRDKLAAVLNKIADAYPDNPFLYEVRKAFKESWK